MTYDYTCPHCHEQFEFDEDPTGQSFDCISCGKRFTVYEVDTQPKPPRRTKPKSAPKPKYCYTFGLLFGIIGIFIGHMMDGQAGAKEAARGFFMQIILAGGGIMVFYWAPVIAKFISK